MTSINLEKIREYFKIHEYLRSENPAKYYLCRGIFLYVFLLPERYYASTK